MPLFVWITDVFAGFSILRVRTIWPFGLLPAIQRLLENKMPAVSLKNMDVDALLGLRADVEKALTERARDLHRQLGRPGRPTGRVERASTLRGVKLAPKYRGPGGETWAGRGAKPRWMAALLKEGHSIDEFAIARKGGKKTSARRGRKAAAKKSGR
jgi:DNA-binding protein H-NS